MTQNEEYKKSLNKYKIISTQKINLTCAEYNLKKEEKNIFIMRVFTVENTLL
jgi:hypothetical protein